MLKYASLLVISPTRLIVKRLGNSAGTDKNARGNILRRWNQWLFQFEVVLATALTIVSVKFPQRISVIVVGLLLLYSWSRVNEIVIAFYQDAFWHLHKKPMATDLSPAERVGMALKSYAGLAINFAVLYHLLPLDQKFSQCITDYGDTLYFSFVTIATLGYGDISPVHSMIRLLAVYEVLAGILVLVIAVATYIGGSSESEN